jgi:GH25 family lysozyme M1 (1,4-beta-N-acetylmuramidase)
MDQKFKRRGIDVSHYQGDIGWKAVHESGVNDVYLKWSEFHVDHKVTEYLAQLAEFRPDVRNDGIDPFRVGLYHLWHGELGPDQADELIEAYLTRGAHLHHAPAIDLETDDGKHPEYRFLKDATSADLDMLLNIVSRICMAFGACRLYLSERGAKALRMLGFWDRLWAIDGTQLWLCDHGSTPHQPDGAPLWTWWQHGNGPVPGITHDDGKPVVDLNYVRLGLEVLEP